MIEALERSLDALGHRLHALFMEWWAWPAALAILGALVWLAGLAVTPVGEDVHLLGFDLFGPCEYQERTGRPCGSCGMTRSWLWSARLQLGRAWTYNPAGTLLFGAFVGSGALGAVRLLTRRPGLLGVPWKVVALLWGAWAVVFASQLVAAWAG